LTIPSFLLIRVYCTFFSHNIFENVDLSLEALLVGGEEGGEFNPSSAEDTTGFLGSNMCFLKLKVSF